MAPIICRSRIAFLFRSFASHGPRHLATTPTAPKKVYLGKLLLIFYSKAQGIRTVEVKKRPSLIGRQPHSRDWRLGRTGTMITREIVKRAKIPSIRKSRESDQLQLTCRTTFTVD